jgi:hypothetical protein
MARTPRRAQGSSAKAPPVQPKRPAAQTRALVAKLFDPGWYARCRFGDPAVTGEALPAMDPGELLTD